MDNNLRTHRELGYDDFFEANRQKLGLGGFSVARVVVEYKGAYKVVNQNGEFLARVTGKQMFVASSRADYPAVGDWVAITELDSEQAVIEGILPRKTIIRRRSSGKDEAQIIGTNIDVAFVVESVDRDYNLNRYERYFVIARDGGVKPAIILNKIDLIPKAELDSKLAEIANRFPDIDVILTSTVSHEGLDELRARISKGRTYCFLGSSGVGKSSLINKLIGEDSIRVENISTYSDRGRHITTSREMYFLENGGIVVDNPGMREIGLAGGSEGINGLFDEITALGRQCGYADCTHTHEPNCQVVAAVKSGRLDEDQYHNYISLKKEADYYEMSELEKKEKDRSFGRFVKKAKKDLKGFR